MNTWNLEKYPKLMPSRSTALCNRIDEGSVAGKWANRRSLSLSVNSSVWHVFSICSGKLRWLIATRFGLKTGLVHFSLNPTLHAQCAGFREVHASERMNALPNP